MKKLDTDIFIAVTEAQWRYYSHFKLEAYGIIKKELI